MLFRSHQITSTLFWESQDYKVELMKFMTLHRCSCCSCWAVPVKRFLTGNRDGGDGWLGLALAQMCSNPASPVNTGDIKVKIPCESLFSLCNGFYVDRRGTQTSA